MVWRKTFSNIQISSNFRCHVFIPRMPCVVRKKNLLQIFNYYPLKGYLWYTVQLGTPKVDGFARSSTLYLRNYLTDSSNLFFILELLLYRFYERVLIFRAKARFFPRMHSFQYCRRTAFLQ